MRDEEGRKKEASKVKQTTRQSNMKVLYCLQTIPGLLERIQVHHLFNLFDLLGLLESVSERVSNQTDWLHTNLHLLLVDSVTPLLSPLLGGHGGQGHALLSHLASQLRRIAYEHSMAVVVNKCEM